MSSRGIRYVVYVRPLSESCADEIAGFCRWPPSLFVYTYAFYVTRLPIRSILNQQERIIPILLSHFSGGRI